MTLAPQAIAPDDPDVLPAVRELLMQRPSYRQCSATEIAEGICFLGYMNYRPREAAVEAALEALVVEDEVLP